MESVKSYIRSISVWLPENQLTNDTISKQHPEWSIDKISSKTGIYSRHIADSATFVSDMAVSAAERLYEESDLKRENTDFILLCTQSPDYFLPTTACMVQSRLKLPNTIGALDFNLGCSGYVYGLSLAKGLIESGSARNVLLITSETYSRFIHPKDKSNKTLFGDGATATWVSVDPGDLSIDTFQFGTDGDGAENLIVKNGALRYPDRDGIDILDEKNSYIRNDDHLFMNGTEIFKFTSVFVPKLVQQTLEKNELGMEEIDFFIFHQANQFMLDFIRKRLKIPKERFVYQLRDTGNTVSGTIPIALKALQETKEYAQASKLLLAGFGVGYSWAGCVLSRS